MQPAAMFIPTCLQHMKCMQPWNPIWWTLYQDSNNSISDSVRTPIPVSRRLTLSSVDSTPSSSPPLQSRYYLAAHLNSVQTPPPSTTTHPRALPRSRPRLHLSSRSACTLLIRPVFGVVLQQLTLQLLRARGHLQAAMHTPQHHRPLQHPSMAD